jgi:hypothetical protein
MRLEVDRVIAGVGLALLLRRFALGQQRRHGVHAHIEVGVVLGLAGDDQRRARLVDQDRVDLVDDGVGEAALHALARRIDHVVAQVVEAEFVVGAVGDVGGVGRLLLVVRHLRKVDADREPRKR